MVLYLDEYCNCYIIFRISFSNLDYEVKVLNCNTEICTSQIFVALTVLFLPHQVSLMIRRDLTQRAEDFNIILDDVSITELSFGREYTSAVEAKQVSSGTIIISVSPATYLSVYRTVPVLYLSCLIVALHLTHSMNFINGGCTV